MKIYNHQRNRSFQLTSVKDKDLHVLKIGGNIASELDITVPLDMAELMELRFLINGYIRRQKDIK